MSLTEEYWEDRVSSNNISSCLYEEMVFCELRLPELPEETTPPQCIELTGCPVRPHIKYSFYTHFFFMIQVNLDEQDEENKMPTKEQNNHEINEINEDTVRHKDNNENKFDEPYPEVV